MAQLIELHLDSGYVARCRPVPPLMTQGTMSKPEFRYPPPPTIEVSVQKGRATETVPAPDGSTEMEAYLKTCWEVDEARDRAAQQFTFSYGVVDWKEEEGTRFSKNPPKGWNMDEFMKLAFGEDVSRRVAFIMAELIVSVKDLRQVQAIIMPSEGGLISGAEVQAAEDAFQGDVQES